MIGTIRKHSKWLWGVIITVTITTFIFWGSASNSGNRNRKVNFGSVDGEPITQDAFASAEREAWLDFFFNSGNTRGNFDSQRLPLTYQRLFWIKRLNEYNIQPDDAAVQAAAADILRANGLTLDKFAQHIYPNANIADFERYLRHQLGIQQLAAVVGLSSELVTLPEVEALYRRDYQELASEAVFFSATNFIGTVANPSEETIKAFYNSRLADYRLNDRVQVNYLKFDPTNFLADADLEIGKITNLTERLEEAYQDFQKRNTNQTRDVRSPDEIKKEIFQNNRHYIAMNFAHRKAESVAEVLYDMKPVLPENLAKVAATNGLALKRTVPFEENTGPTDLDAGMNFTKAAFALSEEEPLTESPIRDGDNFFLLAFDKKLPSEIQPLEKVRDRVIADYKQEQAVQLARRAGNQFAEAVTNGMAKGKTFAAIAADAKIKPVTVPSISYGTRILPEVEDHVSLFEFKRVAFNTPVGKTSNFVETENGGMVVYVRQLLPIDEAKMKADLPGFLRTVHQVRRQETINNWFQREASKALRDTPLSQPSPTGPPGAGPRRS